MTQNIEPPLKRRKIDFLQQNNFHTNYQISPNYSRQIQYEIPPVVPNYTPSVNIPIDIVSESEDSFPDSSSNLHSHAHIQSQSQLTLWPMKPRRSDADYQRIKSIFRNIEDQKNFTQILRILDMTELSVMYDIPLNVNKEIAEFAMGHIHKCLMTKCDHDILQLNNVSMYFDEFEGKWRCHRYQMNEYCLNCIHDVTLRVKKIMREIDLTQVSRRQVRIKLRHYFGMGMEFESPEWKRLIKYHIYDFLR